MDDAATSPALWSDGFIYMGSDDNNLYALDSNGSFQWSYNTNYNTKTSPVVGSG